MVSQLHRSSRDDRLPWLAGRYSPSEDVAFFESVVYEACEIWGSFERSRLIGFIAFRANWMDHLYVLPAEQRRGSGTALLGVAKRENSGLDLWTFQRNEGAISFYRRNGFVEVERTDGHRNEEHEPDVHLRWRA